MSVLPIESSLYIIQDSCGNLSRVNKVNEQRRKKVRKSRQRLVTPFSMLQPHVTTVHAYNTIQIPTNVARRISLETSTQPSSVLTVEMWEHLRYGRHAAPAPRKSVLYRVCSEFPCANSRPALSQD